MEAPDKIYIPQHNIEAGTIQELCELIVEGSVEYIRKDLLLEWAEDNLLECEASNDETDYGRIDAYKKLIDKLNSL